MPVAGAAIGAAATIIGSAIASRGSNRAAQAQQDAAQEALDFQRQQYADEQARNQREEALALAEWQQGQSQAAQRWDLARSVLSRYGYNLPEFAAAPMPEGWAQQEINRNLHGGWQGSPLLMALPAWGTRLPEGYTASDYAQNLPDYPSDANGISPKDMITPALQGPSAGVTLQQFLERSRQPRAW